MEEQKEKKVITPPGWNFSKGHFDTVAKLSEEMVRFRQALDPEGLLTSFESLVMLTASLIWKDEKDTELLLLRSRLRTAGRVIRAGGMSPVERQEKYTAVYHDLYDLASSYYFLLTRHGLLVPLKEKTDEEDTPG